MNSKFQSTAKFIFACALLSLAVSSCRHTVRGIGQDVERVGDRIEHASH